MSDENVIHTLNELLDAEQANLAPRLVESSVFVSDDSVRASNLVRSMARRTKQNCEHLTSLIFDLGGAPWPRAYDVNTTNLHYQTLSFAMPLLRHSHERLVESYRRRVPLLAGRPKAAKIASDILAKHERDLDQLRGLSSDAVEAPVAG